MDLKKDERYYHPNLLNRWFGISSIIFLGALVAMFGDDYIRDWKGYQREFRRLDINKTRIELEAGQTKIDSTLLGELEAKRSAAEASLARQQDQSAQLETRIVEAEGELHWATMRYQENNAELGAARYRLEQALANGENVKKAQQHYDQLADQVRIYKGNEEQFQTLVDQFKQEVTDLRSAMKEAEDELAALLKNVSLLERKLSIIDPQNMTLGNRITDMVRDLPVMDFLAPSIKIQQIIVDDIRDDVIFTTVPKVDRCTSCHLGVDQAGFDDAPQPFRTHPRLELFLASSSPHPLEEFGCTSCHAGRGRGTSFSSAAHMPATPEQAQEWKEKYDWEELHHWDEKMYPAQYSEAGCLKCHYLEPIIAGGDNLSLGLTIIEKAACFGCHELERYAGWRRRGPNLAHVTDKLEKDFAFKWIRNPRSFRHNAWMPTFFAQTNSADPASVRRTQTEIHAMVQYLFGSSTPVEYPEGLQLDTGAGPVGDAARGEELVASLGCLGCHVVEPEPVVVEITLDRMYQRHGPNIIGLGSKVTPQWLFNWLKNPSVYNSYTRMPNLRLSDQEAADMTAYLLAMRNREFEQMEVPPLDVEELDNIAIRWLAKQNTEAAARRQVEAMSPDERLMFVGQKSILFYGCFSCHNIPGFENAKPIGTPLTFEGSKPVHNLAFGSIHEIGHTNYNWFEAKLTDPRIFDRDMVKPYDEKLRMPNFYFTPTEVEALVTALLGMVKADVRTEKLANQDVDSQIVLQGRAIIKNHNCQGCHIIDGQGGQITSLIGDPNLSPPNLNTEGAKVYADWLYSFLKEPTIIRPNLTVRMPTFDLNDLQWNDIIKSFQYADGTPATFVAIHDVDGSAGLPVGEFLASKEIGDCGKCHLIAGAKPTGNTADWAPDLALSRDRLRSEWMVRWLRDPQNIMPGTRMPQPYIPSKEDVDFEGAEDFFPKSLIELAGDTEALLESLRDYVYSVGN